jgi:peptidoglycan-associated lipoprotein
MKMHVFAALAGAAFLAACSSTPSATTGTAGGMGTPVTGSTDVGGTEEGLVRVGDRVFFAFNESSISDEAQATLDKQASWMAKYPNVTVQVAGNCDDRGTEEYNLALGQRRANAARDYLVAKGVASSRITTISYGKDRPTALGDDEQAWAQNRNAITSVK